MSIKFDGELEYNIVGQDETISHDTTNLTMTIELEEYSKLTTKDDDTQYRTVHELNTNEGKFKWETIISVGNEGISQETELIEQPSKIEVIQDLQCEIEENE